LADVSATGLAVASAAKSASDQTRKHREMIRT
jgi:hypothetical protein